MPLETIHLYNVLKQRLTSNFSIIPYHTINIIFQVLNHIIKTCEYSCSYMAHGFADYGFRFVSKVWPLAPVKRHRATCL